MPGARLGPRTLSAISTISAIPPFPPFPLFRHFRHFRHSLVKSRPSAALTNLTITKSANITILKM